MFLGLLAKRTTLRSLLSKKDVRSHPKLLAFLKALEDAHAGKENPKLPVFSLAYSKLCALLVKAPHRSPHWKAEITNFAAVMGKDVAYEQYASPKPRLSAFGEQVRFYPHLLGGSRIFRSGTLSDSSWRGRVQAFTKSITF